jgi:hypothetical protein
MKFCQWSVNSLDAEELRRAMGVTSTAARTAAAGVAVAWPMRPPMTAPATTGRGSNPTPHTRPPQRITGFEALTSAPT